MKKTILILLAIVVGGAVVTVPIGMGVFLLSKRFLSNPDYVTGVAPGTSWQDANEKVDYVDKLRRDKDWLIDTPEIGIPSPGDDCLKLVRKTVLGYGMSAGTKVPQRKNAAYDSRADSRPGSSLAFTDYFGNVSVGYAPEKMGTRLHITLEKGNSDLKIISAVCLASPAESKLVAGKTTGFLVLADVKGKTYGSEYRLPLIFEIRGIYLGNGKIAEGWRYQRLNLNATWDPIWYWADHSNYNRICERRAGNVSQFHLLFAHLFALDGYTFIRGEQREIWTDGGPGRTSYAKWGQEAQTLLEPFVKEATILKVTKEYDGLPYDSSRLVNYRTAVTEITAKLDVQSRMTWNEELGNNIPELIKRVQSVAAGLSSTRSTLREYELILP